MYLIVLVQEIRLDSIFVLVLIATATILVPIGTWPGCSRIHMYLVLKLRAGNFGIHRTFF